MADWLALLADPSSFEAWCKDKIRFESTTTMPDHDDVADTASTTSLSSYDDNRIKVVCRVRPPVSRETHGARTLAHRCVAVREDKRTVTLNSKPQEKNFTFDYAAGEDSTQEELFSEVCCFVARVVGLHKRKKKKPTDRSVLQ